MKTVSLLGNVYNSLCKRLNVPLTITLLLSLVALGFSTLITFLHIMNIMDNETLLLSVLLISAPVSILVIGAFCLLMYSFIDKVNRTTLLGECIFLMLHIIPSFILVGLFTITLTLVVWLVVNPFLLFTTLFLQ